MPDMHLNTREQYIPISKCGLEQIHQHGSSLGVWFPSCSCTASFFTLLNPCRVFACHQEDYIDHEYLQWTGEGLSVESLPWILTGGLPASQDTWLSYPFGCFLLLDTAGSYRMFCFLFVKGGTFLWTLQWTDIYIMGDLQQKFIKKGGKLLADHLDKQC